MSDNPLRNIPFEQMLGEPVRACIQAQADAAQSAQRYLDAVAFTTDEIGRKKAVVVSFRYQKDNQILELSIPLMALVPIPSFSVDTLDIAFDARVDFCNESHLECTFVDRGSKKLSEDSYNPQTHHLSVKLHASQDHMPVGLSRLLYFLDETIALEEEREVQPPTATLLLRHEKIELKLGSRVDLYLAGGDVAKESITWSSSDPDIAKVDRNGRVRVLSAGIAYIFAETDDAQGMCEVRVIDPNALPDSSSGSSGTGYGMGLISSKTSSGSSSGSGGTGYGMRLIKRKRERFEKPRRDRLRGRVIRKES